MQLERAANVPTESIVVSLLAVVSLMRAERCERDRAYGIVVRVEALVATCALFLFDTKKRKVCALFERLLFVREWWGVCSLRNDGRSLDASCWTRKWQLSMEL